MNKLIAATAFTACLMAGSAALAEQRAKTSGAYAAPSKSTGDIQLKSAPIKENAAEASLTRIKSELQSLSKRGATKNSQRTALKQALAETATLKKNLSKLDAKDPGVRNAKASVNALRDKLNAALKDLEAQDKLGNFEIQRLMSQYNQSEQLASSVLKKKDDTSSSVIGKVG